jgi:hypothetical protein
MEHLHFCNVLRSLFDENHGLLSLVKRDLVTEAVQCVDEVSEHYGRIKAQRPLTDEEKREGRAYVHLMESARRMLRI